MNFIDTILNLKHKLSNILIIIFVIVGFIFVFWDRFKTGPIDKSDSPIQYKDSFTVVYRVPINEYKVTAVVKTDVNEYNYADLTFTKDGHSFSLHSSSFGDTIFNKGFWGVMGENLEIMNHYKNQSIEADYNETTFFFKDMDFDGTEELVIVNYTMAVRNHSSYDIYRIIQDQPFLIDYPPYRNRYDTNEGMTDYPEFDYNAKTISCPYPEGDVKYDGCIIYGISNKQKDTIVVNGIKHLFNHIEIIKEEDY